MSAPRKTFAVAFTVAAAVAVLASPVATADPADPAAPVDATTVVDAPPCPLANGVPHLPSPQNLPPGATDTPPPSGSRTMSYLRDVWQALRTRDITAGDALMLIAQRPMDLPPPPN